MEFHSTLVFSECHLFEGHTFDGVLHILEALVALQLSSKHGEVGLGFMDNVLLGFRAEQHLSYIELLFEIPDNGFETV